jgi:hypothetical protein
LNFIFPPEWHRHLLYGGEPGLPLVGAPGIYKPNDFFAVIGLLHLVYYIAAQKTTALTRISMAGVTNRTKSYGMTELHRSTIGQHEQHPALCAEEKYAI